MFYVYQITNNINGKKYIGAHATDDVDDGYMGSGVLLKRAIKKYGVENFSKVILSVHSSMEDMYSEEAKLITEDMINSTEYYNLKLGGQGDSKLADDITIKRNKKISGIIKDQYKNGREPNRHFLTDEERKYRSEFNKGKNTGKDNHMYGKSVADFMTEEDNKKRIEKIKKANTGKVRTAEHKKRYSEYASSRFWIVNSDGKLKHATDENDPRLLSGEWQRGRKWNTD